MSLKFYPALYSTDDIKSALFLLFCVNKWMMFQGENVSEGIMLINE